MTQKYEVGQTMMVDGKASIIIEVSGSGLFYDSMPLEDIFWTIPDQEEALGQGWGLFQTDGKLKIQRYDESQCFDSDWAAQNYVENSGDGICRKAKAYLLTKKLG